MTTTVQWTTIGPVYVAKIGKAVLLAVPEGDIWHAACTHSPMPDFVERYGRNLTGFTCQTLDDAKWLAETAYRETQT